MQTWNIEYLRQLHSKYDRLAMDTEDISMVLEYESTANSILDIIDRYNEMIGRKRISVRNIESINHRDVISSDFKMISDYESYLPYIRLLADYNKILNITPNTRLPMIDTSATKIITISHAFYEQFKGVYCDTFREIAINFKDTVHMNKITGSAITVGQTYSVYNTDIVFFELGYNNTLQDYVSAIHEFGHGISCRLNPTSFWNFAKYCFIEVDSLFFEMLGTDYLGDKLGKKKDAFDINMHVLKDYIYTASLVNTKLRMYSECDRFDLNSKLFVKHYLHKELGLRRIGVNDILKTYIREYMHYIISYLTAIELYLIYQNDADLALNLLFKIIDCKKDNNKEILEYVKSLGLEPGKNIDTYISLLFEKAKDVKDEKSLRYSY